MGAMSFVGRGVATHPGSLYKRLYMEPGLGTRLRQLIEFLDRGVDDSYQAAGLDFRARFYPYFCMLLERQDRSVGEFASYLGFSQPAVTQTLALMRDAGLIEPIHCQDRRRRRFRLTAKSLAMLPDLQRIWSAAAGAAAALDRALPAPLGGTASIALTLLSSKPFSEMIEEELLRADNIREPDGGVPGRSGILATERSD